MYDSNFINGRILIDLDFFPFHVRVRRVESNYLNAVIKNLSVANLNKDNNDMYTLISAKGK